MTPAPPGAGRRRAENLEPVVGAAQGFALHGPIGGEVAERNQAAVGLHVGGDKLRGAPAVELVRAVLGQTLQDTGEVALLQRLSEGDGPPVFAEDFAGLGEPRQAIAFP